MILNLLYVDNVKTKIYTVTKNINEKVMKRFYPNHIQNNPETIILYYYSFESIQTNDLSIKQQ